MFRKLFTVARIPLLKFRKPLVAASLISFTTFCCIEDKVV